MKDNTIITIADPVAAVAFLDKWDEAAQEQIWKELRLSPERATRILSTIGNPQMPDIDGVYIKDQCEKYLKVHPLKK